ncbi:MAG: homoserine dehydrogenase, partial [Anaerolineaceae bacterium]|nr:homoserine dehydrogenase [Anaerolineaceae bacterium]
VGGVTNAIVYSTRLLGDVMMQGPGAGRLQTGYAIIQDLFSIYR